MITLGETNLVRFAAGTIVGRRRTVNEDAFAVVVTAHVFVVADGATRAAFQGDIASQLVIAEFQRACVPSEEVSASCLVDAVRAAHERIKEANRLRPVVSPGIAAVAAVHVGLESLTMVHVGDPRVGVFSPNPPGLSWLTADHTLLNERRVAGIVEEEPAYGNILTRSVGLSETLDVEITRREWGDATHVLLCTDGLWRQVEDRQLLFIATNPAESLGKRLEQMLVASDESGGEDNATAILIERRG